MADILIRGMDKPHNCFQCDLSYLRGERLFCHVTKDEVLRSKIAPDCPIHELPEHGDLIDRDAFDADARKRYCSACDNYNGVKCRACWVDDMLGDVVDFETVIPSNKDGNYGN